MAHSLDDRMVEVELVEGAAPSELAPGRLTRRRGTGDLVPVGTEPGGEREDPGAGAAVAAAALVSEPTVAPRGRTRRRLLAALGALAAGTLVVTATLLERAELELRDRALAAMPGVVGSVQQPLRTLWEHPAGRGSVLVDDVLLLDDPADRPSVYVAVDATSGRELWRVERGPDGLVDWCGGALVGDGPPMALCWGSGAVVDAATGGSTPAAATVMGLSLADGHVVFEREMDPPSGGYGTLEGDLVAADVDGSVLTVRRLDPRTGEERWSASASVLVPGADGTLQPLVQVSHGFVVVRGPTAIVLAGDDGRELGRWGPTAHTSNAPWDLFGAAVTTSDRGFGVWTGTSGGSQRPRGTWFDRDGREVTEIPGDPVEPKVTDGSAPSVLLVQEHAGTDLQAVDLATGHVLWSVDLRGGRVLMRRDGAAVLCDDGRVAAVDLQTGQELWATAVEGLRPDAGSVTDGQRVVVVAVRDRSWRLDAVELDSGDLVWTAQAPESSVLAEFVVPGSNGVTLGQVAGRAVSVHQRSVLGLG